MLIKFEINDKVINDKTVSPGSPFNCYIARAIKNKLGEKVYVCVSNFISIGLNSFKNETTERLWDWQVKFLDENLYPTPISFEFDIDLDKVANANLLN